jgi:hypothetical protein
MTMLANWKERPSKDRGAMPLATKSSMMGGSRGAAGGRQVPVGPSIRSYRGVQESVEQERDSSVQEQPHSDLAAVVGRASTVYHRIR